MLLLLFLFTFLIAIMLYLVNNSYHYLVIENLEQAGEKYYLPVQEEEEFTIKYIHSVDLLPVYEIYSHHRGNIQLKETHFYNFGAGMGLLKDRGVYVEEGDLLKIIEINEQVEPFVLRTGEVPNQILMHRGKNYMLAEHFGNDARLLLKTTELSGIELFTKALIPGEEIKTK